VKVRMLLFAGLRERAGQQELEFDDLPAGTTIAAVVARARARVPGLERLPFRIAHNRSLVPTAAASEVAVAEGDELALLPPVSGG